MPIFVAIHAIPFDVSLVRAIPYTLENGKVTSDAAAKFRSDLGARLEQAISGAASQDSPISSSFQNSPRSTCRMK